MNARLVFYSHYEYNINLKNRKKKRLAAMDMSQLRYFVSVAQSKNFTYAAKQNYISQPSISRRINDLEKELGVTLLVRDSHKVELTQAGEEFYKYAVKTLDDTIEVQRRLRNISTGRTGLIRISSVQSMESWIIPIISKFTKAYPDIQVDLTFSTGKGQIENINTEGADIYFSFQSLLEATGNLNIKVLNTDRYSLIVPNEYADRIDVNDFSTLAGLPLVQEFSTEGPFLVSQVLEICRNRGIDIDKNNVVECNSIRSLSVMVNSGIGYSVFPESCSRSLCTEYVTEFPIPGDDAVVVNAVGWNRNFKNEAKRRFVSFIEKFQV